VDPELAFCTFGSGHTLTGAPYITILWAKYGPLLGWIDLLLRSGIPTEEKISKRIEDVTFYHLALFDE
jgi:hypothetical protein